MTEQPGLRERQKAVRRNQLVDAAQTLVEEHGLDGVTVEQICARAGVSPRTFFNYFESKDDAAIGLRRWTISPESSATFVAGGPHGDIVRDLVALFADQLGSSIAPHHLGRAMRLVKADLRLYQRHHAVVAQHRTELATLIRQRMGDDLPETRVQLLMSLLWVVMSGAWVRWEADHGWRYAPGRADGPRDTANVTAVTGELGDPDADDSEPDTLNQLLAYVDPVISDIREVLGSG